MKGNDLDNVIVARDIVVWEGLLGLLTSPKKVEDASKYFKRKRWDKALECYETNHLLAQRITDSLWRLSYEIDVLTYLGQGFADELNHRLHNVEDLPVRKVFFEDPYLLARRLSSRPDIRFVYDPDPNHQFVFGSKGRVMLPGDFNMLGA